MAISPRLATRSFFITASRTRSTCSRLIPVANHFGATSYCRSVPCVTAWLLDPEVLHLNHGSFGATPAGVLEAQQAVRTHIEANPTRFFLEGEYQESLDEVRRVVARFVGADEAGLVFVTNATAGVNAVLRSLEPILSPGDEILVTDHEYNACANAAVVSAARAG
ncbi:MAG: aminotransferase class V-fold PLP-dependent enzyme, partial [Acidimicrobiales bacterium]|nr:aminotransferase class V-fold PLP-dependent enzyme [Acidimicrobiales bacterium]